MHRRILLQRLSRAASVSLLGSFHLASFAALAVFDLC